MTSARSGALAFLARYLRPAWRQLSLLALLLLLGTAAQVINPLLLRRVLDGATSGAPSYVLIQLAATFILVALLSQLAAVLEAALAADIGWRATNQLRTELTAHCLALDLSFHHAHLPGDLIQRIDYDVGILTNFLSRFLLQVVVSLLLLLGVLLVLFRLDWRIGSAFAVFVAGSLLLLQRLRRVTTPTARADLQAMSDLYGYLEERLAGTEDLRARGATDYVMAGLYRQLLQRMTARRRAGVAFALLLGTMSLVTALGTALAYTLGGHLYRGHMLSLGTVYAVVAYVALVARPLGQLTREAQDLQQATAGISRVQELLAQTSRLQDGAGGPLPPGPLTVELEQVGFGYGDNPVLTQLSFTVPAGSVLGVLGRTGSGKSTLARLLLRLYDPNEGIIRLGGVDLRELRQVEIRRRVGLVTQEVQLFDASLRDNLTFFDPTIPDAQLLAILRLLGLWSWYERLPQGLETRLGGTHGGLSAGEAQLLALARVFLKDPGLVILDEATSRLDPSTERQLEAVIDQLLQQRTGILVAHRLATVARCDTILILDEGRIVEWGERVELAADPTSRYARLLRTGVEVLA